LPKMGRVLRRATDAMMVPVEAIRDISRRHCGCAREHRGWRYAEWGPGVPGGLRKCAKQWARRGRKHLLRMTPRKVCSRCAVPGAGGRSV
jgi:hypothetical protein